MASTLRSLHLRGIDRLLFGSLNFTPFGYPIGRQFTLVQSFGATRKATWQPNVPAPPKRPQSSYFLFVTERGPEIRAQLKRDNPGVKPTEVTKHFGQLWRMLPDTQKEAFIKQSEVKFAAYAKEMAAYQKLLTEEDKMAIKQRKEERKKEKESRILKQKLRESKKPKRPLTGFFYYSQLFNERRPTDMPVKDWAKELSQSWSQLSTTEKMRYQQEANAHRAAYEKELSKWIQSMVLTGRQSLVSKSELKKELERLGKPVNARNPLQIYLAENVGSGSLVSNVKKYSMLSDAVKKGYVAKAAADKSRFQSELKNWENTITGRGLGEFVEAAERILKEGRKRTPRKTVSKKKTRGSRKTKRKTTARKTRKLKKTEE